MVKPGNCRDILHFLTFFLSSKILAKQLQPSLHIPVVLSQPLLLRKSLQIFQFLFVLGLVYSIRPGMMMGAEPHPETLSFGCLSIRPTDTMVPLQTNGSAAKKADFFSLQDTLTVSFSHASPTPPTWPGFLPPAWFRCPNFGTPESPLLIASSSLCCHRRRSQNNKGQ